MGKRSRAVTEGSTFTFMMLVVYYLVKNYTGIPLLPEGPEGLMYVALGSVSTSISLLIHGREKKRQDRGIVQEEVKVAPSQPPQEPAREGQAQGATESGGIGEIKEMLGKILDAIQEKGKEESKPEGPSEAKEEKPKEGSVMGSGDKGKGLDERLKALVETSDLPPEAGQPITLDDIEKLKVALEGLQQVVSSLKELQGKSTG